MAILDNENVSFIKLNGSEVYLVKLDGNILYKKTPLYVPYEFRDNSTITEVETIVNDTHSDLSYMFYNCISLVSANTIDWDTSNVTNMNYMFANCDSLTELDLSNFDTSNVKYTEYMFVGCNLLTKVNLNNWDLTNVSDAGYMFNSYCESLVELRLDNCNFETLKWIVTSSLYPKDLVNGEKRKMYLKKENITDSEGYKLVPPSGWEFVYVSDTEEPVDPEIPPVEPEEPEEPETPLDEFKGNDTITEVQTIVNDTHTDLSCMFEGCTALTTVNTTDWDTSNVTNMSRMFYGCNNICDLEVNNWDTSKVTDMSYMFYDCFDRAVSALNLSNWNTSEVTNMDSMFCACNKLQYLNISNFDLTKVTNTDNMLAGSLLDSFSKLRLDNCSRNTIEKIITSEGFPTSDYGSREIYVRSSQINNLTPPEGWVFVYVD